jgi:ABC-type multidrug transport system fused ATPase/permease subunit
MLNLRHYWNTYYRKAARYMRPYWPLAAVSVASTLGSTCVALLMPWPMKILVDSVLGNAPLPGPVNWLGQIAPYKFELLIAMVVAGFALVLASGTLDVVDNYASTKLNLAMELDFRSDMFQQAQRLSMAFHDQGRPGALIYVINSMASSVTGVVTSLLPIGQNTLTLLGMFWISLRISPRLALLSLTVVPAIYYSIGYYSTHISGRLRKVKGIESETLSIIHEAISMLRVIVAFGREDHEHARLREQGQRAIDARIDVTVRQTVFALAVNTATAIGTALVLGYGSWLALQQRLTVGELLIILAYIGSVYKPLEAISGTIATLQDKFVSLQLAFDLMEREPDIQDAPDAIVLSNVKGHVEFDRVSFHYPDRESTLVDISFEVSPGQAIAIVGATGAGKSTLVSLLPRFYDALDGRILIDGVDVRKATLRSLRQHISIVMQESMLFSMSIADNIRYARPDATMDEIVEAAKAANAHDFITRLPEGYDTLLNERGAKLSGGERQRVAVARAFLRNAPILILDEPTSSIDSKTEAVILDALERLMVGRTTFLVAHRLSTLRSVSTILVLDHGRVVEHGSHEELLALGGRYRQLHDMQTGKLRPQLTMRSTEASVLA